MTVRSKSKTKPHASTTVEPASVSPEPSQDVAARLAVRETPEKLNAPAFDPGSDTSVSYARLVHWYTSGADGGRRSFLATARHYGVDESTVRDQAKKGRWLERAAQTDRQLLAKELGAGLAVQRRATVAHIALAEKLTGIIERAVAKLEADEDNEDVSAMDTITTALEACKTLQRAQAAARVAMGLPTSTSRVDVNVSGFGGEASDKPDYDRLDNPTVQLEILGAAAALNTIMRGTSPAQLHVVDARALVRVETACSPALEGESIAERYARIAARYGITSHG